MKIKAGKSAECGCKTGQGKHREATGGKHSPRKGPKTLQEITGERKKTAALTGILFN